MRAFLLSLLTAAVSTAPLCAGEAREFTASTSSQIVSDEQKEDIGDIRPEGSKGLASYFHGSAQKQVQFTTNARLRDDHSSGDGVLLPSLQGGFAVPVGGGVSLDLIGRLDSVLFADNTDRALWGGGIAATVNWRPIEQGPRFYATAEPYYYADWEDGDQLASAIGLTAGVEENLVLNRGRSLLFAGYSFSHYFADPSPDDRNVNRFIIGLTQQLHPRLYAQLYYSFQYSDYESRDRSDLRQIGGLNFTWQFATNLFGTFATSLVDNDSTLALAQYQSFIVSAGLTWQF
jgi:hypothetical protein